MGHGHHALTAHCRDGVVGIVAAENSAVRTFAAYNGIIPQSALKHVSTGTARQGVVTQATGHAIGYGRVALGRGYCISRCCQIGAANLNQVGHAVLVQVALSDLLLQADKAVAELQAFDVAQCVGAVSRARTIARHGKRTVAIFGNGVGGRRSCVFGHVDHDAAGAVDTVVAAIERVVARATNQHVAPFAAIELVCTRCAKQAVTCGSTREHICGLGTSDLRTVRPAVTVQILCGGTGLQHHKTVKEGQGLNARERVRALAAIVLTKGVGHPNQHIRATGVGCIPGLAAVRTVGNGVACKSALVARHVEAGVAPGVFAVGPAHDQVVSCAALKIIGASAAGQGVVAFVAADGVAHAWVFVSRHVNHIAQQRAVLGYISRGAVFVLVDPGFDAQAQVTVFETQRLDVGECVGSVAVGLAVGHRHRTVAVGRDGVACIFAAVLHCVGAHISPLVELAIGATVQGVVARATAEPVASGARCDGVIAFVALEVVITRVVVLRARRTGAVADLVVFLGAVHIGAHDGQRFPFDRGIGRKRTLVINLHVQRHPFVVEGQSLDIDDGVHARTTGQRGQAVGHQPAAHASLRCCFGLGHHGVQCGSDIGLAQRGQRCCCSRAKGSHGCAGTGQVQGRTAQRPGALGLRERHLDQVVAAEVAFKTHLIAHLAAPLVGACVGATVHIVIACTGAHRLATAAAHIDVIAVTQVHVDTSAHQFRLFFAGQGDQLGHIDRVVIGRASDVHPVQGAVLVPVVRTGADVDLQWAVGKPQRLHVKDQVCTLATQV